MKRILQDRLRIPFAYERKTVERDTIVENGTFHWTPLTDDNGSDNEDDYNGIQEFLESVAGEAHCSLVNESSKPETADLATGVPGDAMKLEEELGDSLFLLGDEKLWEQERWQHLQHVLDVLSKYTGLQFRIERRSVPVWFFTGGPSSPDGPSERETS